MEPRRECGRCLTALPEDATAYFCAKECTFCPTCYRRLRYTCPNCSGELVRRPRRASSGNAIRSSVPPPKNATVSVRPAGQGDVGALVPLFDAYRQFYEQPPDPEASERFLSERLSRSESVAFLAEEGGAAVGFVQLYPLFSSISLGRTYVLNDLFVTPTARKKGVGARLLETARQWAERQGAHYLELSTAVDNPAQRLYEDSGWVLDREFLHYELPLTAVIPPP